VTKHKRALRASPHLPKPGRAFGFAQARLWGTHLSSPASCQGVPFQNTSFFRELKKRSTHYFRMTTFMLHGVSERVSGRDCAPSVVVVGEAQVLVPDGSGGVPLGEPERS
jgi:hypothetical protein